MPDGRSERGDLRWVDEQHLVTTRARQLHACARIRLHAARVEGDVEDIAEDRDGVADGAGGLACGREVGDETADVDALDAGDALLAEDWKDFTCEQALVAVPGARLQMNRSGQPLARPRLEADSPDPRVEPLAPLEVGLGAGHELLGVALGPERARPLLAVRVAVPRLPPVT